MRKERPVSPETDPARNIKQVSFSITCLEEGLHIPRTVGKLAREKIPDGKDVFIAISDNGSRGAMELIQPEDDLSKKRLALQHQLSLVPNGQDAQKDFIEYVQNSARLRILRMQLIANSDVTVVQEYSQLLIHQSKAVDMLATILPSNLENKLYEYALAEDMQQELLGRAISHPEEIIEQAEEKGHYHYTHHLKGTSEYDQHEKPNDEQKETIRAYAEILSGKFSESPSVRVAVVGGSQMGSFGSARKFGVEAVERDFATRHPGTDLQSHAVLAGFDMDSDFDEGMIGHIINTFQDNPAAKLILPSLNGTEDVPGKPGQVGETKRSKAVRKLPKYDEVGMFLADLLNGETYYNREGKTGRHYLPAGTAGFSKFFGIPNLHIGPFICMRGDALKNAPMEEIAAQGEDFFATAKTRRLYPEPEHVAHNPAIKLYFNFRGIVLRETLNFLNESVQDTNVVPFRHKLLKKVLGDHFPEFHNEINGYAHRDELVGELTRRIDEERYGLAPHEYVARQVWHPRKMGALHKQRWTTGVNQRIVDATDVPLKRDFTALVRRVPDIALAENEYISKQLTSKKMEEKIKRGKYKGERIVTSGDGKKYLVRTHMYDTDDLGERIHIATPPSQTVQ